MRLIILDRDGVINHDSDDYIKCPQEWRPIASSLQAIKLLKQHGYQIAVATNQSGIGRGYYDEKMLQAMHKKMHDVVHAAGGTIDYIAYCPHHPDDHCDCRKPKTGLFTQIANHFQCRLEGVPLIGDSISDIKSARAIGATPYLVKTGKGERTLVNNPDLKDVMIFADLLAVVNYLVTDQHAR